MFDSICSSVRLCWGKRSGRTIRTPVIRAFPWTVWDPEGQKPVVRTGETCNWILNDTAYSYWLFLECIRFSNSETREKVLGLHGKFSLCRKALKILNLSRQI